MATLADAYVRIRPDSDRFGPELRADTERAGTDAGTNAGHHFGSAMITAVKAAGVALAVGGLFLGKKTFDFLKQATQDASDLNETVSKSQQIFPKTQAAINAFAATSATSLGLSKQAALEGAASFGNFFNQIGIGEATSAKMSTSLIQLSADLGSFNNADPAKVMESFLSATRGEYDSLQQFIPTVNAATVQTEALRLSHKKSVKDLTEADKATALYSIAFRDAGKAQGDFARTADGAANASRTFQAKVKDIRAEIGTAFLPVLTALYGQLNNKLMPALEDLWAKHGPQVIAWLTTATSKIGPLIDRLAAMDWRKFGDDAKGAFDKLGPALKQVKDSAGPELFDGLRVGGEVLSFLASHADLLAKALPYLAAGFLVVKTAQAAGNVAALASVPLRAAEVISQIGMRAAIRAHTSALVENTAAKEVSTVATVANTGAEDVSIVTRSRSIISMVAHKVASVASAAVTGVWTAAQWLLNASFYGFPLVWIIVAIAALIAAVWLIVANWDAISKWIGQAWDWLAKKAHDVFFAVWHTIVDAWQNAVNFTRSLLQAISDWVQGRIDDVLNHVRKVLAVYGIFLDAFGRARDAVFQKVGELLAFVQSIPGKIWGFLSGLGGSLFNLGIQMIQGLINGIRSAAGRIRDALLAVLPGPLRAFAGALGISSPSKVFFRYGVDTIRGYTIAVRGQAGNVVDAIRSVVPQLPDPYGRSTNSADDRFGLGGGLDALAALLQKVIDAVDRVAPGVGSEINGSVGTMRVLARSK